MKKNINSTDKMIRVLLASILALSVIFNLVTGVWGIVLSAAALILLLTSIIEFCPIYFALGINTNKTKARKHVRINQ